MSNIGESVLLALVWFVFLFEGTFCIHVHQEIVAIASNIGEASFCLGVVCVLVQRFSRDDILVQTWPEVEKVTRTEVLML